MDKAIIKICVLFYAACFSICPVGVSMAETGLETAVVTGYPSSFDGMGEICFFKDSYISIDDRSFQLSSRVTFNTPYSLNCSSAWFSAGKYVGYLLDSTGAVKSLWLIDKSSTATSRE